MVGPRALVLEIAKLIELNARLSAPKAKGFVHWCLAADEARLADSVERLHRRLRAPA